MGAKEKPFGLAQGVPADPDDLSTRRITSITLNGQGLYIDGCYIDPDSIEINAKAGTVRLTLKYDDIEISLEEK